MTRERGPASSHSPDVTQQAGDRDSSQPPPPDQTEDNAPDHSRRGGLTGRVARLLPRPVRHIGRLLILALIIEYLVVPQLAGPRKVAHLLTQVNPLLLLAGLALEIGAWLSYAELTRTVLPKTSELDLFTLARIQMTTLSVSHCAPGGTAAGAALGYRLMTQAGVKGGDVGFALATQGIGSAIVLNLMLWLALIVSFPVWGFSPVYLAAAIVGLLLLGAASGLLVFFTRGGDRAGSALEHAASHLPFVDGKALRRSFDEVARRLENLAGNRRLLIRAIAWASANWLLDAGSLAVFVGAFGKWVNPDGILVAYGLANVLAVIPITPGGLGVVEATLTSLLVGFDTPRGVATLGVIVYRLVNFWLPIPLGGVAYLSLQVDRGSSDGRGGRLAWVRHLLPHRHRHIEMQDSERPHGQPTGDH